MPLAKIGDVSRGKWGFRGMLNLVLDMMSF